MATREPTAAQALFGHLPSAARPELEQSKPTTAQALYPGLRSTAPRQLSYEERKAAWSDHMLALSGLVRRKS
jgi:hypothetical protein